MGDAESTDIPFMLFGYFGQEGIVGRKRVYWQFPSSRIPGTGAGSPLTFGENIAICGDIQSRFSGEPMVQQRGVAEIAGVFFGTRETERFGRAAAASGTLPVRRPGRVGNRKLKRTDGHRRFCKGYRFFAVQEPLLASEPAKREDARDLTAEGRLF